MAEIGHLPIPHFHRTAEEALGTASNLVDQKVVKKILVIGEASDGDLIFLSAGDGEQLTIADALFMMEMAKILMLHPGRYERVG
jgi:hypothetical protein